MAADTVVTGYGVRTEEGTGRFDYLKGTMGHHSGTAFRRWRVDPCGGRFVWRRWRFFDKALRVFTERLVERDLAGGVNGIGLAVMHLVRSHEADPGMVMVPIVPVEELAAETPGILDAAEAFGEARLIFQGLEVAFGERVVVGRMRAVMRAGDSKIGEQERGGLRFHRGTAIGMERELAGRHVMFRYRII